MTGVIDVVENHGLGVGMPTVCDRLAVCEILKQHRQKWIDLRSDVIRNLEKYAYQLADLQYIGGDSLFERLIVGPPEEDQKKALGRLRDLLKGPTLHRPQESVQHLIRFTPLRR